MSDEPGLFLHKDQILLIRDDMWVDDVINVMSAINLFLQDDKIQFVDGVDAVPHQDASASISVMLRNQSSSIPRSSTPPNSLLTIKTIRPRPSNVCPCPWQSFLPFPWSKGHLGTRSPHSEG